MGCSDSKAADALKPQTPIVAPVAVSAAKAPAALEKAAIETKLADDKVVNNVSTKIASSEKKVKAAEDNLQKSANAVAVENISSSSTSEAGKAEAAALAAWEEKEAALAAQEQGNPVKILPTPIKPLVYTGASASVNTDDIDLSIPSSSIPTAPEITKAVVSLQPNIGFVIKSRRPDGQKVFINIFYHEKLSSMISTPAKSSIDKSGNSCYAYDVMIPYITFIGCSEDENFRDKLCLESIALVNSLYNDSLSTAYIIPKMKRGFVGDDVEAMEVPSALVVSASRLGQAAKGGADETDTWQQTSKELFQ